MIVYTVGQRSLASSYNILPFKPDLSPHSRLNRYPTAQSLPSLALSIMIILDLASLASLLCYYQKGMLKLYRWSSLRRVSGLSKHRLQQAGKSHSISGFGPPQSENKSSKFPSVRNKQIDSGILPVNRLSWRGNSLSCKS
jgi:hypothetical protein